MTPRLVAAALMALLLAGCGVFVAPSATPGALTDIVSSLVLRNMTITDQVAGDAGCPDPTLHSNAVRYDVSMAGEVGSHSVYVFGWKDQASFDAAKTAFDACVDDYLTNHAGGSMSSLEHSPWRAYIPNYSIALSNAVDEALVAAGGAP